MKIRVNEISILLPTFSGGSHEDVESFINTFDYTKRILNVSDDLMKLLMMKQFEGRAKIWMFSSPDFVLKTYQEIIRDVRHMFGVAESKYELWKTLDRIKWNDHQPFNEYCLFKKLVAQKLEISESELVEYVVEGIVDDVLRNQAQMQNFKTMEDVVQAFRMIRPSDVRCSRKKSIR